MASPTRPIAAWLLREQLPFVRAVAERAGCLLVAVGSPQRGHSASIASEIGSECTAFDDPRSMLMQAPGEAVWLATGSGFGAGHAQEDAAAIAAARSRNARVISTDPMPSNVLDLSSGWLRDSGSAPPAHWVRFAALPRLSRPVREAAETLATFGAPRAAHVECWSSPLQGSLGARLIGACDFLSNLFGEAETVDAAYVGPRTGAGIHPLPGETLADLHGDLFATLRFADGRAASVSCSNAAGRWSVGATLISDNGRLRFYDDGFEWAGPMGEKRDDMRLRGITRGADDAESRSVAAFADSIARLLDPGLPDSSPTDVGSVLSIAQAALLSARTGHPESPATIRRLLNISL